MTDLLYTRGQIRACEQAAYHDLAITPDELMERAGAAAFSLFQRVFPEVQKILVYCGSGNNAGDGYVFARLALAAGYSVTINQFKDPSTLPPTAQKAARAALLAGVNIHQTALDPNEIEAEVIIDALLGTGLQGLVSEPYLSSINTINESNLPVLALDIPSGLQADSGEVMGMAVKAHYTITFIAKKLGLYTLDGPDHCGKIYEDDLQLGALLEQFPPAGACLTPYSFPPRLKNSHKRDYGHVLIIGGNQGMFGAVQLAGQAALRVGAGMVTIAAHPAYSHTGGIIPELMVYGCETGDELEPLLNKASICILGPGLGMDAWAEQLFKQVISTHLPMIIDASALRLLALNPQQDDNWILTPHPGEAAALLGINTEIVQENRFDAVVDLQKQYGGTIVLKGVGTLIRAEEPCIYVCPTGNPGMASAGMGDVLSGVIGGLLAQGLLLPEAAKTGVWIHGKAGDAVAKEAGERGIIASDLFAYLHHFVNLQ